MQMERHTSNKSKDAQQENRELATRHFLLGRCWHPVLTLGVDTYPNVIRFGRCQHPVSALGVNTYQKRYCFGIGIALIGVDTYQRRYRFGRCQHLAILRCWHPVSTPCIAIGVDTGWYRGLWSIVDDIILLCGVNTYQSKILFARCWHLPKRYLLW